MLSASLCVATQSFVRVTADTCQCTSVVLFLESDVAVVGPMTVRTAQIRGRKIASEIIALMRDLKISEGIGVGTNH